MIWMFSSTLYAGENSFSYSLNADIGEKFIFSKIQDYLGKANPCYLGVGFSKDLFWGFTFVPVSFGNQVRANVDGIEIYATLGYAP